MSAMLLIKGDNGNDWFSTLCKAASGLGRSVTWTDHTQIGKSLREQDYELAILDANTIPDPVSTVNAIRSGDPRVRIVVVSSIPHWKEARELLLRGATDYVRKVDDEAAVRHMLENSLSRVPSEGEHPHAEARRTDESR